VRRATRRAGAVRVVGASDVVGLVREVAASKSYRERGLGHHEGAGSGRFAALDQPSLAPSLDDV
jgi:hypothetical protein